MAGQMLGKNAKLYYNSATFSSPTWVEVTKVRQVKWDLKWNRAKSATRGSLIQRGGKTDGEVPVSFTVEQDLTDAAVLAIRAAIISPTAVFDMMVLNGPSATNGVFGVRGEFDLFSLSDDQGLQNTLAYDVGAEPSATANALQTVLVTSGAPVFSTLAA